MTEAFARPPQPFHRHCKGPKARFRRAEVKETKGGKAVTLRGYFTLAGEHAKKNQ